MDLAMLVCVAMSGRSLAELWIDGELVSTGPFHEIRAVAECLRAPSPERWADLHRSRVESEGSTRYARGTSRGTLKVVK